MTLCLKKVKKEIEGRNMGKSISLLAFSKTYEENNEYLATVNIHTIFKIKIKIK